MNPKQQKETVIPKELSHEEQSTSSSLAEEIKKAWEWVVFVKRLLPRIGGFKSWIRVLSFVISLLITRLLTQWRIIKAKK